MKPNGYFTDVEKVLYSQAVGGVVFALVGGTPQIVLLTTAPLALYTKSKWSMIYWRSFSLCKASVTGNMLAAFSSNEVFKYYGTNLRTESHRLWKEP